MKKVIMLCFAVVVSWCAGAVQVGDVSSEEDVDVWSETDRVTVNNVEYLYTFKGVRHLKYIVTEVYEQGGGSAAPVYDSGVKTHFIIEKAIPLTGNYDVEIQLESLLTAFVEGTCGHWSNCVRKEWDDEEGYHSADFDFSDADLVVIGDSCFEENELLTSIAIMNNSDKVVPLSFANRSFYGCQNLTRVDLQGVTCKRIGDEVFAECTALESVVGWIGEDFTFTALESIGKNAFKNCTSLSRLGVTITTANYRSVYKFDTPNLKCVGGSAFEGTRGGVFVPDESDKWTSNEWIIPPSTIFGYNAFLECGAFTQIKFSEGREEIPEGAFSGYGQVRYYHAGSSYVSYVARILFPNSLKRIGTYAFLGARVLLGQIPEGVTEIGKYALSLDGPIQYEIADTRTSVITNLINRQTVQIPSGVKALAAAQYAGGVSYDGVWNSPNWKDGKIVSLSYRKDWTAVGPYVGNVEVPQQIHTIPYCCFAGNPLLTQVKLHDEITVVEEMAFAGCSSLDLVIPASVVQVGKNIGGSISASGGGTLSGPKAVTFEGLPPKGVAQSGLLGCSQVLVPADYAHEWAAYMNPNVKLARKVDGVWRALGGSVVSAKIRDGVPNVMDITYKVTSIKPTVKVRLVAFKDGERSFAKAVVPATFVADAAGNATEGNLGDAVVPNMEHTVSWQVSSDWGDEKLAKISTEVFVLDDELLPLQLMSLPATETRGKLTFSRNVQSDEKITNALYWLLASHAADLDLTNGTLKRTDTNAILVSNGSLNKANALAYLYGKMGYRVLSGTELTEVNCAVRLSLASGTYAVKVESK